MGKSVNEEVTWRPQIYAEDALKARVASRAYSRTYGKTMRPISRITEIIVDNVWLHARPWRIVIASGE